MQTIYIYTILEMNKIVLIVLICILFAIILHIYNYHSNTNIVEGLTDVSEKNRFKINQNIKNVFDPYINSNRLNNAIKTQQEAVDNYVISANINPALNDASLKTSIQEAINKVQQYKTLYQKLYFMGAYLPVVLDPFLFLENDLSRQYNYLKVCYPKTITNMNDYQQIYSLLVMGQLAKDITTTELCPDTSLYNEENDKEKSVGSKRDQVYSNYYDYITIPILDEISKLLLFFKQK